MVPVEATHTCVDNEGVNLRASNEHPEKQVKPTDKATPGQERQSKDQHLNHRVVWGEDAKAEGQIANQQPEAEKKKTAKQKRQGARQPLHAIHPGNVRSGTMLLGHEPRERRLRVGADPPDDRFQQQFDDKVHGRSVVRTFMAKALDGCYPPGRMSSLWRKVKCSRH